MTAETAMRDLHPFALAEQLDEAYQRGLAEGMAERDASAPWRAVCAVLTELPPLRAALVLPRFRDELVAEEGLFVAADFMDYMKAAVTASGGRGAAWFFAESNEREEPLHEVYARLAALPALEAAHQVLMFRDALIAGVGLREAYQFMNYLFTVSGGESGHHDDA